MERDERRFFVEIGCSSCEDGSCSFSTIYLDNLFRLSRQHSGEYSVYEMSSMGIPRMYLKKLDEFTGKNGTEYLGGLSLRFEVSKGYEVGFWGMDGSLNGSETRLDLNLLYPAGRTEDVEGGFEIREVGEVESNVGRLRLSLK